MKPMTPAQAVKLANAAIDRWIQFDAIAVNLYERYGAPFHGKAQSERRKKLREAKQVLAKMMEDTKE